MVLAAFPIAQYEAFPALLIALVAVLVMGLAMVKVIHMMIMGDVTPVQGLIALTGLLATMAITIASRSEVVAAAAFVVVITLAVFYPYAATQLERLELRQIDVDGLEKVFSNAIAHPDSPVARFQIAAIVYDLGLPGHAIAITETTLQSLSAAVDDVQNRSLRDVFRVEELRAKQWRRDLRDPSAFAPVACPGCGARNSPGTLACEGCGRAYLLDIARELDIKPRFVGRLVIAWAVLALFLVGAVTLTTMLSGALLWLAFLGVMALVGGLLWLLFRDPRLSDAQVL